MVNEPPKTTINRRNALRTIGGTVAVGIGLGAVAPAAAHDEEGHQENYAEIKFNPQRTAGGSLRVARYEPKGDGFITIHTWGLITRGDAANTICGVTGPFGPGRYSNVEVRLFEDGTGYSDAFGDQDRLEESQPLVAVPHRDMNHNSSFEKGTDIPFTNGTQVRNDLPLDGAVNDWADVKVVPDNRKRD